jgi:parallel beta-helix repeat protein
MYFFTSGDSKSKVSGNLLDGCGSGGFRVESGSLGEAKTGDKFTNNVVMNPGRMAFNYGFNFSGGNPSLSGNLIRNAQFGVRLEYAHGATIRNNLFSEIADDVLLQPGGHILNDHSFATIFSGNTVENVQGADGVLYISVSPDPGTTPIKQMAKNNFLNLGDHVEGFTLTGEGVTNMADHGFTTSKNFWGDPGSVDGIPPLDGSAASAVSNGHVTMSPSLKLNPVRYKDRL